MAKKIVVGRPGVKGMNEFIKASHNAAIAQAQAVQKAINKSGVTGLFVPGASKQAKRK